MWSALTSDLNEFVSTVAGDTSEALNRMDENFPDSEVSPAEEERIRRMEMHETFDSPLISDDDPDLYKKDVEAFLADFSIDAKTDEIAKELEENPDTLKLAFEALVPTKVKYDEFWQRYFYRCDIDRITQEIEEEEKADAQTREEAFKSLSSVGNFLNGAVKKASETLAPVGEGGAPAKQANFFGTDGRPPFVMNTAVSNSDESDEEEEELGWDDDDEEEEEDDDHQIEFTDNATEKLEDSLKNALEERDQLHETVALQQKEIASLKEQGAANAAIEHLKTQLFEKESEIAALRASAQDNALSANEKLSAESESTALKELESTKSILAESEKSNEKLRQQNAELLAKVASLEKAAKNADAKYESAQNELNALQEKLEATEREAKETEINAVESEIVEPEKDDHGEESVDSPQTEASGIQIEAPTGVDKTEDEGDWDDDW